jgi:hypothetical protein
VGKLVLAHVSLSALPLMVRCYQCQSDSRVLGPPSAQAGGMSPTQQQPEVKQQPETAHPIHTQYTLHAELEQPLSFSETSQTLPSRHQHRKSPIKEPIPPLGETRAGVRDHTSQHPQSSHGISAGNPRPTPLSRSSIALDIASHTTQHIPLLVRDTALPLHNPPPGWLTVGIMSFCYFSSSFFFCPTETFRLRASASQRQPQLIQTLQFFAETARRAFPP